MGAEGGLLVGFTKALVVVWEYLTLNLLVVDTVVQHAMLRLPWALR